MTSRFGCDTVTQEDNLASDVINGMTSCVFSVHDRCGRVAGGRTRERFRGALAVQFEKKLANVKLSFQIEADFVQ